eukprot:365228-Chlamydomonas_euryale.AAC.40
MLADNGCALCVPTRHRRRYRAPCRFLCRIEDGYDDGIYHCRTHAADVLRTLHAVLNRGQVLSMLCKQQVWPCRRLGGGKKHQGCGDNSLPIALRQVLADSRFRSFAAHGHCWRPRWTPGRLVGIGPYRCVRYRV